ncbi:7503_t:CDS:1 [Gigaspora margarita]|uniref:7503_t:CDS:1 n=1 Tax=Gigaspora margarita TaxID=4874 RepID=A0ABN7UUJ3_GIGMA|nr:7503_t:CDS:1 [Gigaspora margarita]
MSSTSRIESYNSKVKKLIFNSNMTILELAEKLTACILEEDKKTEYSLFHTSAPKAALVATADTILPNICNMPMQVLNCGSIENSRKPSKTIASISHYDNNSRRATKISYCK